MSCNGDATGDELKLPGIMTGDVLLSPKLQRAAAAIKDSPARVQATQDALAEALRRKTAPTEHTTEEPTT